MRQVLDAIGARSSIRGYTAEDLTKEELELILQAGLQAPTATNRQEIHFTVVKRDAEVLKELDAEKNALRGITDAPNVFYYNAHVVIFLSAEKEFRWNSVDAGIAVENMALAAEGLGLGSLIIGCVYDALHGEKERYFGEKLAFPEGYGFEIAIAVGHKAVTKEPHTYEQDRQVTFL